MKLYYDNAPSHTTFIIVGYLVRSKTPVVPQPLYRLPVTFLYFRLKNELKRKHWESLKNIQTHVVRFLKDIPAEEFKSARKDESPQVY